MMKILATAWILAMSAATFDARATVIWKAGNDDNISLASSWWTNETGAVNPASLGTADTLRFGGSGQGTTRTLSLGGDLAVGALRLDNQTGTPNYNVAINSGDTLTLNGNNDYTTGTAQGIVLNSAAGGSMTVNCDIVLGAVQQWVSSRALSVGGNISLGANTLSFNTAGSAVITLSGVVGGTGGLTKSAGTGTLTLSGVSNSFAGAVTVVGGQMNVAKLATIGNLSSIGTGSGTPAITLNGGNLAYTGSGDTTDRSLTMVAGAGVFNNGTGPLSFTAANVAQSGTASARTLTLAGTNSTATNAFALILGDSGTGTSISSLAKSGASLWQLGGVQAYSGSTTVNQGLLRVTGAAVLGGAAGSAVDASNIVFGTANANGTLEFETTANLGAASQVRFRNTGGTAGTGGTLRYVGTTAQTVGKTLQCDSSIGIRLESDSVGGAVTFNGAFSQANRPLYLGGSGAGDNSFSMVFSGSGGLTKYGTGRWVLTQSNAYTGGTTIHNGTLALGAGGSLYGTGGFFGNNGATNLFVNAGGTLETRNWDYGAGNALNEMRNNSYAILINGGTVRFTENTSSLRSFNVGANGATLEAIAGVAYTKLAGTIGADDVIQGFGAAGSLALTGAGNGEIQDGIGAYGTWSAAAGIIKSGAGTWTLSGVNPYTGSTVISNGTLQLGASGSISNTPLVHLVSTASTVDVSAVSGGFHLLAGQQLKGVGTLRGGLIMDPGAQLNPGNSQGTLTVTGDLALSGGTTNYFELAGPNSSDLILVGGALNLGGVQFSDFAFSADAAVGTNVQTYVLIQAASVGGALGSVTNGTVGSHDAYLSVGGAGNSALQLTVIPEPGTVGLLGIFTAALLRRRRLRG